MDESTKHLHIEFFAKPVENKRRSLEEGRPIYDDKEFVKIRFAGDKNRILEAPADDPSVRDPQTNRWVSYKERFPRHYEAFRAGMEFHGDGTPISELPFLTEAKRAELRALNIHTAEALANLDGAALTRLGMGGRALKDQAQSYLDSAKGSAAESRLAKENADLKARMEAMEAQIAALASGKAPVQTVSEDVSDSPFASWADDDLKNWIRDATGSLPKGNPKHETLVRMADEANADLKAREEAA